MTTHHGIDAVVPTIPTPIETVSQAVAEIMRLHGILNDAAVDLTPDYLKQRLDGEEDVTWSIFPRNAFGHPTPILGAVVRYQAAILLGAGYSMFYELLYDYRLTSLPMLVPGDDGTFVKATAITLRRIGRGYDPGEEYVVSGDQLLKAEYRHYGPMPTFGSDGRLTRTYGRDSIGDTFSPLSEVDDKLQKVIEALRAYEPAAVLTV